ncbi:MAG: anti-sigma factor family protein [Sporichthyaceae bacterium]
MTNRDHISTDSLADHAEGLLGESESAQIDAHLAECEECRSAALLLASIPEILAADEVGPMPAHFASRIDAALADLYAAEPVIFRAEPAAATPIAASPIGIDQPGNVVDLASRRKLALTGLRRVSTIAASMVLLIAGAALGIQTLDREKEFVGPSVAQDDLPQPTASRISKVTVPKDTKQGVRKDIRVGKDGTIYTTGKVFLTDGRVLITDKNGNVKQVLTPSAPKKAEEPAATAAPKATKKPAEPPKKGGNGLSTADKQKGAGQQPSRTEAPVTPEQDPAGPGRSVEPSTPAEKSAVTAARQGDTAVPSKDPYVQESYQAYTEDNFAALVMDLIQAARRHGTNQNEFSPSSTQPTATPKPSSSGYRMPTSLRTAFTQWNFPQDTERGPAAEKFQDRVKRCASQLGADAIAGDFGTWKDKPATIIVLQSENPDQVDGYVFYGTCSEDKPITAQSAQWQQRVNKPARDAAPEPTPVRRVGSVQQGTVDSQSRYRS